MLLYLVALAIPECSRVSVIKGVIVYTLSCGGSLAIAHLNMGMGSRRGGASSPVLVGNQLSTGDLLAYIQRVHGICVEIDHRFAGRCGVDCNGGEPTGAAISFGNAGDHAIGQAVDRTTGSLLEVDTFVAALSIDIAIKTASQFTARTLIQSIAHRLRTESILVRTICDFLPVRLGNKTCLVSTGYIIDHQNIAGFGGSAFVNGVIDCDISIGSVCGSILVGGDLCFTGYNLRRRGYAQNFRSLDISNFSSLRGGEIYFNVICSDFKKVNVIPFVNMAVIAGSRTAGSRSGETTIPKNRDFAGTDHGTCTRGCDAGPGRGCKGGKGQCREKQDHCQQKGTNALCSFHNDSPL